MTDEIVAFHAQQAAEKAIRAFLEDDEPFDRARTRDLVVRVVAYARSVIEQEV